MKTLTMSLIGAVCAGIMAASAATPVLAHDYHRGGYERRPDINGHGAVKRCAATATRTANRYGYGRQARVTGIRDVDRTRYGYQVEGRIVVNTMRRDGHYGGMSHGWNRGARGYDTGRFTCKIDYRGRIADLDFSGIRGL